jgi:A/G-specific adenine glycosylase
MLQQTQVARVVERYQRFLELWPRPADLAAVPLADLLVFWQGLGYPRRARNLHGAAAAVVADHFGQIPRDLDKLLALPGVGPYTARAVLVFAYEDDIGVVDTNVGRLLARWAGRSLAISEAQSLADSMVPCGRAWQWNQGLFDLAVAVCRKRDPRCGECPVAPWCQWHTDGGVGTDPAVGSASVSKRQARFEGSDRQYRGRILSAIGTLPRDADELANEVGLAGELDRVIRLLNDLEREGLVWSEVVTSRTPVWRLGSSVRP